MSVDVARMIMAEVPRTKSATHTRVDARVLALLVLLDGGPPQTISEIAVALDISQVTATSMVKDAAFHGLVELLATGRGARGVRGVRVALTRKGQQLRSLRRGGP